MSNTLLVLLLPVATASVERAFSAMNFVKNKNNMEDQYLNDCLVTFIEKDFFFSMLLMKTSSPLSKSHLVELICSFSLLVTYF